MLNTGRVAPILFQLLTNQIHNEKKNVYYPISIGDGDVCIV